MLVLSRRIGESIVIDDQIEITVVSTHGNKVRVGITAPDAVRVDREEVRKRRREFMGERISSDRLEASLVKA